MTWRDGTPIINQYVQETTACTHLPAKSSAASSDKQQTISQSYIAFLVNSARKSIPSWSAFQASAAAPPAQYHLSRGWAETKLQRGIGNVRRSWQTTVESLECCGSCYRFTERVGNRCPEKRGTNSICDQAIVVKRVQEDPCRICKGQLAPYYSQMGQGTGAKRSSVRKHGH
ncbi:hypothetical protein NA56DRAFT_697869 [Hyaloscypha hepaticicola]|uniref:Uncharacterized protein n=1 Tax=Hyaloscypha hepaticicola TaxID=2082293 RepID=A0A2J6QK52_9HELO|nr:hypothetical protein NA56DRAFT_697869 [Hyaloscypha hepaticicola]